MVQSFFIQKKEETTMMISNRVNFEEVKKAAMRIGERSVTA